MFCTKIEILTEKVVLVVLIPTRLQSFGRSKWTTNKFKNSPQTTSRPQNTVSGRFCRSFFSNSFDDTPTFSSWSSGFCNRSGCLNELSDWILVWVLNIWLIIEIPISDQCLSVVFKKFIFLQSTCVINHYSFRLRQFLVYNHKLLDFFWKLTSFFRKEENT